MSTARVLLINLDAQIVRLNASVFPHPADIKSAVSIARDMLAELLQDIEETNARIGLIEEQGK